MATHKLCFLFRCEKYPTEENTYPHIRRDCCTLCLCMPHVIIMYTFFLFPSLVFAFQAFDDETLGMDTGGGKRRALEGGSVALEPPKRARKAAATAKKAEVKPKRTPPPPSSSDKKPPPAKRTKTAAARESGEKVALFFFSNSLLHSVFSYNFHLLFNFNWPFFVFVVPFLLDPRRPSCL